jgi:HAD superfamily hydrolase (TIGR01509 family)
LIVRAVVFDFDGVIANSEPLHYQAYRDVLADQGVTLGRDEYYDRYLGFDDVGAFLAIASDRHVEWRPEAIEELVRRKAVRLEHLERQTSVLFPGAAAAIVRLAAHAPLAIASGALRAEIERVLQREGLTGHFRAIVAAEDTAVSKPAPDPYRRAVQLVGAVVEQVFKPGDCVAIEDSRWGLESARAAGLTTVGITHTYQADALADADAVIESLDRLTWEFLSSLRQRTGSSTAT